MIKRVTVAAALLVHQASAQCCSSLPSDLVSFPNSTTYVSENSAYFSTFQSDLQPACRVTPKSAADVATILNITRNSNGACYFAVESGGHMQWKGANNVAAPGFTIDLSALNEVTLSEDESVVSVGPGVKSVAAYEVLDQKNLTTVAGRVGTVGVGGFLIGGGITYVSYANGWASDNIVNYEVVLANGSIVNVNQSSAPDLYHAIKVGSTNFGIVTRYDLSTFPGSDVISSARTYNLSDRQAVLTDFVDQVQKIADHPEGVAVIVIEIENNTVAYSQEYWDQSLLPAGIDGVTPTSDAVAVVNITTLVTESVEQTVFTDRLRHQWFTLTFTPDAEFMGLVHDKALELFATIKEDIAWTTSFQPIPSSMVAAGAARNGGNPTNLKESDGDHILLALLTSWADPSLDLAMGSVIDQLQAYSEGLAQQRGIWIPFLYLNYADGRQDTYSSSLEDVNGTNAVREKYDPDNFFGQSWRGGFKFPDLSVDVQV